MIRRLGEPVESKFSIRHFGPGKEFSRASHGFRICFCTLNENSYRHFNLHAVAARSAMTLKNGMECKI